MATQWKIRKANPLDSADIVRCIDAAYSSYAASIDDLPSASQGLDQDIASNQV